MKTLTVLIAPESETLWIRKPELLLLTDKALIDKHDFDRIIIRAGRSQFDARISALLEAYANEGYIEIIDYYSLIEPNDRAKIHNASHSLLSKMSFSEKKQAGIYGHEQFANYLGAKLEHLNPGEPLFIRSAKARRKTLKNIDSISKIDESSSEYPKHVSEMQRRAISKWIAAEVLAHRLESEFVFDLDEYRPYAKHIHEHILINKSEICTQTLFSQEQSVPFRIMWDVIRTQLPGLVLDDTDDLLRFKPNRKEFEAFRQILRDMVQYYKEVQDEVILYRYATRRFKDAQDSIQDLFNRLPRRFIRSLPSCLAYLLNKVWIPTSSTTIKEYLHKSESKHFFNKIKDAYGKICCFSMYANRKPLSELTGNNDIKDTDDEDQYWVAGAPLPWYEMKGSA